jgi:fucose 4-O-acetylase-like acetyltransferase
MKIGIDLFRHFLAICVIVQHMRSSRYSDETNASLQSFADYVDGAVAGFFLLSGYFWRQPASLRVFLAKQSVRLLVPFFIFSLLYAVALSVLGKKSLLEGISNTLFLQGAGMQLYFLPMLLLVSGGFAATQSAIGDRYRQSKFVIAASAILLTVLCLYLPTNSSTGPNYALLPFYALAYVVGVLLRLNGEGPTTAVVVFAAGVVGFWDKRFADISLISLLFYLFFRISDFLPEKRLPGSGGVYLLHTPIINFAISIALVSAGITELANASFTVAVTYVVCLMLTLAYIYALPKYRWLLLE